MCNHEWIECGDEKICLLCGQAVKVDEPDPSVTEMIFRQKNRPINQVLHGNSLEILKTLEDNYVDSIVTDPPYELGFMGKKWDSTGIAYNVELWQECLRVLKPGGHLLAFGGTRTYHRMVCAIEDAGFEIRDCIQWLYGSGFPKSLDISKAIDKQLGAEREKVRIPASKVRNPKSINGGHGIEGGERPWMRAALEKGFHEMDGNMPVTPEAKQWEGWGTCLKPANEPIVLARKPLSEKTIADNVLKWGTGGINIDDCRIPTNDKLGGGALTGSFSASEGWDRPWRHDEDVIKEKVQETKLKVAKAESLGRFPANVIFDEEAAAMLDEQQEGVSRFFYCAKASGSERTMGGKVKNNHPTVKPIQLMRYLCRLITPPGGTVLDPFAGSGTTLLAAIQEGFSCIGIEKEPEYCEIIRQRMQEAVQVALPGVASSRKGMNLAPISPAMAENEARFVPDVCAGGAVQQELKFA